MNPSEHQPHDAPPPPQHTPPAILPEAGTPDAPPEAAPASFWQIFRELRAVSLLAILAAALPALGGFLLLGYSETVAQWYRSLGQPGFIVAALLFAVTSGLALLPTYAQSFVLGWTFGLKFGALAALCGAAGGSLIGYITARLAAGDHVEKTLQRFPRTRLIRDELLKRSFWRQLGLVTLIRLPPNSPFAMVNLALTAAGCRISTYLIGSAIGLAPRTLATVWIGSTSATLDPSQGGGRWTLVANIAIALVIVLFIGKLAERALQRIAPAEQAPSQAPAENAPDIPPGVPLTDPQTSRST